MFLRGIVWFILQETILFYVVSDDPQWAQAFFSSRKDVKVSKLPENVSSSFDEYNAWSTGDDVGKKN